MKILSLLLSTLLGFSSLTIAADHQEPEFYTEAMAYFCYQRMDDAYQQAFKEVQEKAAEVCGSAKAVHVTPVSGEVIKTCTLILREGFVCQ